MAKKKITLTKLKKKLWTVFSQYIRLRDKGVCFTCGKCVEGRAYHAGHFITKKLCSPPLFFSELNTHGQCYRCNINLSGNWMAYLENMVETYGQDVVDRMLAQRHEKVTWKQEDYETMIELYKAKLKSLQEKYGKV